jgi:hypothetical protein
MKKGSKVHKIIGEKYTNKDEKIFEIIGYIENDVRGRIIKFESGYQRVTTTRSIYNGTNLVDIYTKKSIYGIAIMDVDNGTKHILYWRWLNMIGRCYSENHAQYLSYGDKGYIVEDYLLKFSNYITFIESLPNYDKLKINPKLYEIDKDIKTNRKSKIYSRETISIVLAEDNLAEENNNKKIKVYQYDLSHNFINEFESITAAAKATNIHVGNIARNVRCQSKSAGGYIWTNKLIK